MSNFRELPKHKNLIEKENDILALKEEDKILLKSELSSKFEHGEIWEAIIVAGEMALSGSNPKEILSGEQIEGMQEELRQLRERIAKSNNKEELLDLARCVYRFKNIGINFPSLNDWEIEKLKKLPNIIKEDNKWPKEHLAYIPQIAGAINIDPKKLKEPEDAEIARVAMENDILSKSEPDSQIESMIICGGLLAQFDKQEASKLIENEIGKTKEWTDLIEYFGKLREKKDGWRFARLLPQMRVIIKLRRELKN
jgi:hypothetical protein